MNEEAINKDTINNDVNKDTINKDTINKDTTNKDTTNKDTTNKDTINNDIINKDTTSKDSINNEESLKRRLLERKHNKKDFDDFGNGDMDYLDYVRDNCIHCGLCTRNCPFLEKYDMCLSGFADKPETTFGCFLCRKCRWVCPMDLDGREVAMQHRFKNPGKFTMLKLEKAPYIFRNNSKKKSDEIVYFGCNFPRVFPETTEEIIRVFSDIGVDFSIDCCGKPVFETGDMDAFNRSKSLFVKMIKDRGVKRIITVCPNCYEMLRHGINEDIQREIDVINIFAYLREKGIGKKTDDEKNMFVPCSDKKDYRILDDIRYFIPNAKIGFKNVNCCGLGGLAGGMEPEIAKGFSEQVRDKDEPICTYCGSCALNFNSKGIDNIEHALSIVMGVNEKPKKTTIGRLLKQKFIR